MMGAVRCQYTAPWDRVKCLFLGNDWKAQHAQEVKPVYAV